MQKTTHLLLLGAVLISAELHPFCDSASVAHSAENFMPPDPIPSNADVRRAIVLAGGYLERACGEDGKFIYEIDTSTGQQSSEYVTARHAGAMFALAMLNASHPSAHARSSLMRAANFLSKNYIRSGVHPGQLAVWAEPASAARPDTDMADLGATALGIIALAEVYKIDATPELLKKLEALGRFARFLQNDNGDFILAYRQTGPVKHFHNPYSPGETALSFVSLYEVDHSRSWLEASGKALDYIGKNRPEATAAPPDHWALIAVSKLLPYCRGDVCPGTARKELMHLTILLADSIIHEQLRNPASPLDGAFDPLGQPGAAAARMEGLLAILELLPHGEFRKKVEAAIYRSIVFLLRAQIISGPFAGGMPEALRTAAINSSEIRIDGVQHALCAWLRYEKIAEQPREANRLGGNK